MADHLKGVKVGDELVLTSSTSINKTRKLGTVKIHKVGTKLVHVLRHPGSPNTGMDAYRIDSGVSNDNYGHRCLWFPADWEAEQRRDGLTEALLKRGVEVWRAGRLSIRTLERLLEVMENPE